VLVDPKDPENVYVYISGSAGIRSPSELPGCNANWQDPNSTYFRIEVIQVPLAHPEQARVINSPRIFNDLVAPERHGDAPEDIEADRREVAQARATGGFVVVRDGRERALGSTTIQPLLDSIVKARGGTGSATAADSAALRAGIQAWYSRQTRRVTPTSGVGSGPTQCHDITVYPAIGLAGGACEGYGFLLDIRDPKNPVRIDQAADSNFSYWHSATFNNDGTKILFTDEWGGGRQPKCRATDKKEWGADAIFTIDANRRMHFRSYYKMPAAQTSVENCVAHNGSLVPIPGRDVMAQAWYQGGISVFDWTDAAHPREIAFFDRGPTDPQTLGLGGSWSVYWYNGALVSSEIARGLDIFELTPSAFLSQNEIDAARTVHYDYLNTQGQPRMAWPPTFALARAYVDQLERSHGLSAQVIASTRQSLATAESASGAQRREELVRLGGVLGPYTGRSSDATKVSMLNATVMALAGATR